jgi:hypothetical protein
VCSIDSGNEWPFNAVKGRSRKGETLDDPDLNKRSFSFVVRSGEDLKSGDVVVVREVRDRGNGEREVLAVPEKAILQEAEKLFAS